MFVMGYYVPFWSVFDVRCLMAVGFSVLIIAFRLQTPECVTVPLFAFIEDLKSEPVVCKR